jgi:dolichol-phosphate mannosyltransferase
LTRADCLHAEKPFRTDRACWVAICSRNVRSAGRIRAQPVGKDTLAGSDEPTVAAFLAVSLPTSPNSRVSLRALIDDLLKQPERKGGRQLLVVVRQSQHLSAQTTRKFHLTATDLSSDGSMHGSMLSVRSPQMVTHQPFHVPKSRVPRLSIVIPLRNEADAISPLVQSIAAVLGAVEFELLLVDDGSTDSTQATCLALAAKDSRIRVLAHPFSAGQSAALHSGVRAAYAAIVATLDGDGQNPPENLPALVAPLIGPRADAACGLVAGQRVGRKDSLSKRLASRFANWLRALVLHDGTRDTGCGLKAFRRDAYLALPYFNHMHRYLPALFARDGWQVQLVDVTHAPRRTGRSNYGNIDRALAGIVDLAGVAWLIHRRKKTTAVSVVPKDIWVPDAVLNHVELTERMS